VGLTETQHAPVGLWRTDRQVYVLFAQKVVHVKEILVHSLNVPFLVAGAHENVEQN
jgi:hypothetical protein